MIIRLSKRVRRRLSQIHSHIAADNERAADSVIERITHSIGYLEKFPEMGRPGAIGGTREHSVPGLSYVIVYRIEGDVVLILTVIHTRQQWPPVDT